MMTIPIILMTAAWMLLTGWLIRACRRMSRAGVKELAPCILPPCLQACATVRTLPWELWETSTPQSRTGFQRLVRGSKALFYSRSADLLDDTSSLYGCD